MADIDGAMGDASIGATVICSSTDTHADLIMQSAAQKKHIFCEKPVDLSLARAQACADAVAASRRGVHDRLPAPLRPDLQRREGAPRRAAKSASPKCWSSPAAIPARRRSSYIKDSGGIFKDMLIHDFDIFRWILDDEADSVLRHRQVPDRPGDRRQRATSIATAVTIRTRAGGSCQINTSRRAAYGYDQRFEVLGSKGMLQAGNHRPTEVTAYSKTEVSSDMPEAFFLERYRAAYAAEIAHFFDAMTHGKPVRTTVPTA